MIPINFLVFLFLALLWFLFDLLAVHHGQVLQQDAFEFLEGVEYFDAPAPVESGGLEEPQVAVLVVVGAAVERFAQNIDLLLNFRVLPSHIILHFADKTKRPPLLAVLPGIVLLEEAQKLLEVVFAVLVVEIDDEGYGSDAEYLYFFCLAVYLQIFDELVLGGELVVELEVVDYSSFGEGPHLFVVVLVFVENPLEIGHSLACLDLLPYLPLQQHLPHQVLIVVAPHYHESRLILGLANFQLLVLHFLTLIFLFSTTHPRPPG